MPMKLQVLKQALGIDVAKDSLSLCLGTLKLDLEKEFIACADITNDAKGHQKIDRWLIKLGVDKEKMVVVMEATGVYHEALALYLHLERLRCECDAVRKGEALRPKPEPALQDRCPRQSDVGHAGL